MAETLTIAGKLSPVGVENIYLKGGGGRPPVAVKNLVLPQKSPICNFSFRSPESPDSLYLNVVRIP